jgi:DNA-binding MarR family transcriptional regulator
MPNRSADSDAEITLDLLTAVESERPHSQRSLANELGVALGLTNAYVRRCVKRGWIKATQAPANRYAYYLTPKGFSEKSRLTARYLRSSFSFYRRARNEVDELLAACVAKGHKRIALAGRGEIAEIAVLCATQHPLEIVAMLDSGNEPTFLGIPVVADVKYAANLDAIIITDMKSGQTTYDKLRPAIPSVDLHAPNILRLDRRKQEGEKP